jgi:phospholipase C
VPTLFDRMQHAGVSWRIYSGEYYWSICPTFWECLGSRQADHLVGVSAVATDARAGRLPNVSLVIPPPDQSAHPPAAMSAADTWLGTIVAAIMRGPEWRSTAIFITFDDCGCFFDHVNPWRYSRDFGVRVPLIIASPYARAGYTDSRPATSSSVLAFIEHTFGLRPLGPCATVDAWDPHCTDDVTGRRGSVTYDYSRAFDYAQSPIAPIDAVRTWLSPRARSWIEHHADIDESAS